MLTWLCTDAFLAGVIRMACLQGTIIITLDNTTKAEPDAGTDLSEVWS